MTIVLKKGDHIVRQLACKAWGKLHQPKEYYLKKGYVEVDESQCSKSKTDKKP